jgi:hypothetical protein
MFENVLAGDIVELTEIDGLGICTTTCPVWPITVGVTTVAVLVTVPP